MNRDYKCSKLLSAMFPVEEAVVSQATRPCQGKMYPSPKTGLEFANPEWHTLWSLVPQLQSVYFDHFGVGWTPNVAAKPLRPRPPYPGAAPSGSLGTSVEPWLPDMALGYGIRDSNHPGL